MHSYRGNFSGQGYRGIRREKGECIGALGGDGSMYTMREV